MLSTFANVINNNIGNKITRQTLIRECDKVAVMRNNFAFSQRYIDKIRRMLTRTGYLADTDKLGVYIVTKPIENGLTTTKLERMYNEELRKEYKQYAH